MSAAHPGSTEIQPFTTERTPRCSKPYYKIGVIGPLCCRYEGHMGPCAEKTIIPKLVTDQLSQPYNPNRR